MHWMEVKQIIQYLKGTLDLRLRIGGKHISVKKYLDVDWSNDVGNHRSTSGYLVGEGAVLWDRKRKQTLAQSIMEVNYIAMSRCTREAIWLKQLMKDVGCVQEDDMTIMCNN